MKGLDIRNKTITNEIFDEDDTLVVNALAAEILYGDKQAAEIVNNVN